MTKETSIDRDFLNCLARSPRAEAWTGYGNGFLGCLAETAPAEAYSMENDVFQVVRRDASGGSLQKRKTVFINSNKGGKP
ncbi:hypothetical protein ACFLRT_01605 [Acidobacteriota bacterium]